MYQPSCKGHDHTANKSNRLAGCGAPVSDKDRNVVSGDIELC